MQMRQRLLLFSASIISLTAILFGSAPISTLLSQKVDMGMDMAANQCQASCNPGQITAAPASKAEEEKQKDKEPQPAEPYYLAFLSVGWSATLVFAAFLQRHLQWRPPDFITLYGTYRI